MYENCLACSRYSVDVSSMFLFPRRAQQLYDQNIRLFILLCRQFSQGKNKKETMTPSSPGATENYKCVFSIQAKDYYQLAITALLINFLSSDVLILLLHKDMNEQQVNIPLFGSSHSLRSASIIMDCTFAGLIPPKQRVISWNLLSILSSIVR